jgi:hypothetical protein
MGGEELKIERKGDDELNKLQADINALKEEAAQVHAQRSRGAWLGFDPSQKGRNKNPRSDDSWTRLPLLLRACTPSHPLP